MTDLARMTISELGDLIQERKVSPVEVVQATLDRVDRLNGGLNAFISVYPDLAMEAARRVIPEVFEELTALTGRRYPVMDAYHMDEAEVALVLLNSAAETAKIPVGHNSEPPASSSENSANKAGDRAPTIWRLSALGAPNARALSSIDSSI